MVPALLKVPRLLVLLNLLRVAPASLINPPAKLPLLSKLSMVPLFVSALVMVPPFALTKLLMLFVFSKLARVP